MELIFTFLIFCFVLYSLFKPVKVATLKHKNIWVEVIPSLISERNLLFGEFGISNRIFDNKTRKIQVIFPNLTADGDLDYEYNWIPLCSVNIPKKKQKTGEKRVRLEMAQKITQPVIEHQQIISELKELNEQYNELKELLNLVSTSDFYANQKILYERGLSQVKELITKAENLEKTYYHLIRESLIGLRLANYNPDQIPNHHIALDRQYQEIKEEYEYMKDKATAYNELLNNRQI